MVQSQDYLAVLSKAMMEDGTAGDRESYNSLYAIVHSELSTQIKSSLYPAAPSLMKQINSMLDDMEPLLVCHEMIGKACLLLSAYRTNELFAVLNSAFMNSAFTRWLSEISTQIPFVVTHGDEGYIEALNYANQRVRLSPAEYRLLITQSGKSHVALNKIIQTFIIHTPLKREDACLVFDNIYGAAGQTFKRAICKRVIYLNRTGLANLKRRGLHNCDAITCGADLEKELPEVCAVYRCQFVKQSELEDYLNNYVFPILYGFQDEFRAIQTRIESYYLNAVKQTKATNQEIIGDITRMGDGADQTLTAIKNNTQAKVEAFEKERTKIHNILVRTEAFVMQVENQLHDVICSEKVVPRRVYDDLFTALFDSGKNEGVGREIHARLTALEYSKCDLVTAYLRSKPGLRFDITYEPVKMGEWEKAKMYLEIADLNHLSPKSIKGYVSNIPDSRMTTGKEYYAKSIVATGHAKIIALQESFDRGYEPAGEALLARYKEGDYLVNVRTLANALIPEACMMMAEQQESNGFNNHKRANLSDSQFAYYKIAAAKEHLPAIGKIVDSVYQSRFAQAYQLHGDQFTDSKYHAMIENGQALCQLCRFLLDKMYQVTHFSEILGVVLFCLNDNLSEAMTLLSGIDTGVANYCKGNMYEFGTGVTKDIDQAITHYQRALNSDFQPELLQKRINACYGKIQIQEDTESSYNYYQEDKSYHSTTSNYSSSSSLCVITTAACQALNAADDCNELQLLRWFRDTHLQDTVEGEAIVREYYRVGGLITRGIDNTHNANETYRYLWDQYIVPSCDAIRAEQWEVARSIYAQMVRRLCEKFGIAIHPQIHEALKEWKIEDAETSGVDSNK